MSYHTSMDYTTAGYQPYTVFYPEDQQHMMGGYHHQAGHQQRRAYHQTTGAHQFDVRGFNQFGRSWKNGGQHVSNPNQRRNNQHQGVVRAFNQRAAVNAAHFAGSTHMDPLSGIHVCGTVFQESDTKIFDDAIYSLYVDRIAPEASTVKARIGQLGGCVELQEKFLDMVPFMPHFKICYNNTTGVSSVLYVREFRNKDGSTHKGFVDPQSATDDYGDEMWQEFKTYLENLVKRLKARDPDAHRFLECATGRYPLAVFLHKSKLPFMAGMALGQVCHIVERAHSQKFLMYEGGKLLPAQFCKSLTNAVLGVPTDISAGPHKGGSGWVESAEELMKLVHDLLMIEPDGFNLSTLKSKIEARFNKRLSQTMFHHTKLLELVQDHPLNEVCKIVRLQGNCGYLMQPAWDNEAMWGELQRQLAASNTPRNLNLQQMFALTQEQNLRQELNSAGARRAGA